MLTYHLARKPGKMGLVECKDDSPEKQSNSGKISEVSAQKMTNVITFCVVFLTGVTLALLVSWIPCFHDFLNLIDRSHKTFYGLSPPSAGFGRIGGPDHPSLSVKKKADVSSGMSSKSNVLALLKNLCYSLLSRQF
jgi:hypothetical protein